YHFSPTRHGLQSLMVGRGVLASSRVPSIGSPRASRGRRRVVGRGTCVMSIAGRLRPPRKKWMRQWLVVLALACGTLWWGWSRLTPSLVARGVTAYQRGHWREASRLAQERLETAPNDTKALRLLARSTARLGRFARSQEFYDRLNVHELEAEDYSLLGLGLSV